MTSPFVVYGLIDPRDDSVFYVGITCNVDVKKRVREHCNDPASCAWRVCQIIGPRNVRHCIFGKFLTKKPAKILEGRLILSLPCLVNSRTFHALPSSTFYPDWQDLRVEH